MGSNINQRAIAQVQTDDRNQNQSQSNIITRLQNVAKNAILQNNFLTQVALVVGSNSINHLLGRKLVGWNITRQRGLANVYDNQDSNPNQSTTLILVSDAVVTVDLMVF